jgi:hypothetical protein
VASKKLVIQMMALAVLKFGYLPASQFIGY